MKKGLDLEPGRIRPDLERSRIYTRGLGSRAKTGIGSRAKTGLFSTFHTQKFSQLYTHEISDVLMLVKIAIAIYY